MLSQERYTRNQQNEQTASYKLVCTTPGRWTDNRYELNFDEELSERRYLCFYLEAIP